MKDLTNSLKLLPIVVVIIWNFSLTYLIYLFLFVLTYGIISHIYITNSNIRNIEAQYDAIRRANALMDWETHNDLIKRYEFIKQIILADESLTEKNKIAVIEKFDKLYDYDKVLNNKGIKRTCENCQENCLATYYCEHCMRKYLNANFFNWTSGNNDIDNLIQNYQKESFAPNRIVEWIPYDNLKNITEGECPETYSATWVNGFYNEWDAKKQQIIRSGTCPVILKKLEDVESTNRNWFEETLIHLNLSNKCIEITRCFGLTQDQMSRNLFLVIEKMDVNLRKYLFKNYYTLTWNKRISIVCDIVIAISRIHTANTIHRDLNSRNILLSSDQWYVGGLGFSGPINKPLKSIYGNLPYVAPEVITGKEYTFASDIYSIGILMWEISSAQLPFNDYKHDINLAMKIVNGMRPKITSGTPLEYIKLMEQCWDADPLKRPTIITLGEELMKIRKSYYQDESNQSDNFINLSKYSKYYDSFQSSQSKTNSNSRYQYASTSKLYHFEGLPEPKNIIEEEQEAFHSKPYSFNIHDVNIESDDQTNNISKSIFQDDNEISSNNNNQETNTVQQQIKRIYISSDDEERHNKANLHSEEQDQLEIPDDIF